MKSIELIVRLIIKRENKILLCISKDQDNYFLPGGHVEFGESLVDTIYRELKEEIALEKNQISNVRYKDFLENTYDQKDGKHQELLMIFNADINVDSEIISQEGHLDFEWVEMSEIQNIKFLPKSMIPVL